MEAVMTADAPQVVPSLLSDELRIMRRPIAAYRELSRHHAPESSRWLLLRGPLLWALSMGVFVSFTTAGRLSWPHLLMAPLSWSFFPFWGIVWTGLLTRKAPVKLPLARRIDLYFKSYGPWYVTVLLWSGICIFSPHTRVLMTQLAIPLMGIQLLLFGWSATTTWAMYRSAFGFSRGGAIGRTALYYLGVLGCILMYYLLAGQLVPILVPAS